MAMLRSACVAAASAVVAGLVLRRLVRRPSVKTCGCGCAIHHALPVTPSKSRGARLAAVASPEDDDATPPRQERLHSDPSAVTKRTSNLSWEEYFMAVAFLSAQRSKDPNRQVGACVVNGDQKIVGIGYNGFPWGCSDDVLPWGKKGESLLDTKYPYVCHAELNAIMNANSKTLKGCTIYVTLYPCNECAKLIIQARISRVIFFSDMYHDTTSTLASKRMFGLAGIEVVRYSSKRSGLALDFAGMC